MSPIAGVSETSPEAPLRRVRHEVRDGVLLMSFSAAFSCGAAGVLMLLSRTLG